MLETIKKAFKIKEVRLKVLFTLLLLLFYRFGCYIPVPGIGSQLIDQETLGSVTYLGIMSMMTGGSLASGTWFALGISPYINSSIIVQLLTVAFPRLERWSKEGEEGRRKINSLTRILALVLAIIQAVGILLNFGSNLTEATGATPLATLLGGGGFGTFLAYAVAVIFYCSGAVVVVWIGERITDYGVSNGISLLIFAGILATAGQGVIRLFGNAFGSAGSKQGFWTLLWYIIAIIIIFGCIVFVDGAERKIQVQYAKQVKGRKMYGGQSTVIPIKVNANGVMPLIFAFSIVSFPELIITMFWPLSKAARWWSEYMGTSSWLYMIILCVLIFAFAFFYNQIQFNPDDISKSIQQNGGFIPGIRAGRPTTDYLKKISKRITLFGAIFLAFIALIPSIIFRYIDPATSSIFTATGMLIAVSVALEFNTALESQIMMKNYKGFLK